MLVQGHRAFVSFRENHWRGLADRRTMAPHDVVAHAAKTDGLHHSAGHDCRLPRRLKAVEQANNVSNLACCRIFFMLSN